MAGYSWPFRKAVRSQRRGDLSSADMIADKGFTDTNNFFLLQKTDYKKIVVWPMVKGM